MDPPVAVRASSACRGSGLSGSAKWCSYDWPRWVDRLAPAPGAVQRPTLAGDAEYLRGGVFTHPPMGSCQIAIR